MTVSDTPTRIKYDCNGILLDFAFIFNIYDTTELIVVVTDSDGVETTLTAGSEYTVACVNDDCSNGGTVSVDNVGLVPSGSTITIAMDVDITQESDFTEGMAALYETFEEELDKRVRVEQQLQEQINRCVKIPISDDPSVDMTTPDTANRANTVQAYDSNGEPTTYPDFTFYTVTAFMLTFLDDASASEALSTLGVSTFVKTILDDASADDVLTTLGVSEFAKTILDDADLATMQGTLDVAGLTAGGDFTTPPTINSKVIANLSDAQAFIGVQTLTSPVLNTGVSGTAIKDEDNMVSNSDTHLATQQSIKQFVDGSTAAVLLDEDDFASDDDTKAPTQQSTKAFVSKPTYSDDVASFETLSGSVKILATVDLGTVAIGDKFLVIGDALITTGGVSGTVTVEIQKNTGTATPVFLHGATVLSVYYQPSFPINTTSRRNASLIMEITVAGTLTLKMNGAASGSDCTYGSGSNGMSVIQLEKA